MHEKAIAAKVLEDAQSLVKGNIKSITIEVGDLAHLPAHDLEHSLKDIFK